MKSFLSIHQEHPHRTVATMMIMITHIVGNIQIEGSLLVPKHRSSVQYTVRPLVTVGPTARAAFFKRDHIEVLKHNTAY